MANLFGFEIRRRSQEAEQAKTPSFVTEFEDDGALIVAAGGMYGTFVDMEGSAKTEAELINRYRQMAMHPEVENAVDDIVNESIVSEDSTDIVKLDLDKVQNVSSNIKKIIQTEFQSIIELLNFNNQAYDLFKRWYVDGRLYYHIVIDVTKPQEGIQELRYIDPRKIRKVKEVRRRKDPKTAVTVPEVAKEFYMYSEKGFASNVGTANPNPSSASGGVKIAKDSILHVTSGLMDVNNTLVLSYLHKAIKALNQLRTLEDATVIYRVSRAPERRIFYIDVGNLPKMKAEQYLRDMMIRYKNRVVYDAATGEIRDDRKFMTMLEDYWLPRREGGRGTEIDTLPGGQNLGEMADVEYFQKKLYEALGVPPSRLNQEGGFNIGRDSEITRDEVKFSKFVNRLRLKFSQIFLKALEKQVVLKGIMTLDEWNDIVQDIKVVYQNDNFYAELKDIEILKERINALAMVDPYVGKYYSHTWTRKNILKQTDAEMEEMNSEIEEESQDPQYLGLMFPNPQDVMAQQQASEQQDGGGDEQTPPQTSR
jgi:hypothetical protein